MRNGKHYVPVRMTKSEKREFLKASVSYAVPLRKQFLYWLVNDMIVNEKAARDLFQNHKASFKASNQY